ncbi:MAG TPA: NADH-quinone oxidoreductase subunit NuoK [Cytophagaceae bacterium]|nr:NADH-quinone oxidoreductase subunit NuoK [Cytophagaceae bacterium]
MIPLVHYLIISAILFCVGIVIILTKRNIILVLAGIELMLNAANINLVAFSTQDSMLHGQLFVLFVMVVAAAEAAIALAIIVQVYRHFKSTNLDEISKLKD